MSGTTTAGRPRPAATIAAPLLVTLAAVGLGSSVGAQDVAPPSGTIAYLEDRVRVRTIEADGSADQVLFGLTPEATSGIQAVAWRPDGGRLAIASGHEELCSIWVADLYLMDADGTDVTRLTNGPACADLASLPLGTVRVAVENPTAEAIEVLLHAQGLEQAQAVVVEAGFRATVDLPVRDLGPEVPQFVVATTVPTTWFDPAVYADVAEGTTADAGTLTLDGPGIDTLGALSASWSPDGTRLAYQLGLGALWQIEAGAGQLGIGGPLFTADDAALAATSPVWSPVDDRVIYQRFDTDPSTIDVGRADADRVGDPVVAVTLTHGMDWLPDGSGFIVSDSSALLDRANLLLADLATGSVTQVTGYDVGFALWPTISPDGRYVAYGYSPVPLDEATSVELRVRHLGTGQDELLVANGLNPDWGS